MPQNCTYSFKPPSRPWFLTCHDERVFAQKGLLHWTSVLIEALPRSQRSSAKKWGGNYLTHPGIISIYTNHIRRRMEYCCNIRTGAAQSSFTCLKNCRCGLLGNILFSTIEHFSRRRNFANLSLLYSHSVLMSYIACSHQLLPL